MRESESIFETMAKKQKEIEQYRALWKTSNAKLRLRSEISDLKESIQLNIWELERAEDAEMCNIEKKLHENIQKLRLLHYELNQIQQPVVD